MFFKVGDNYADWIRLGFEWKDTKHFSCRQMTTSFDIQKCTTCSKVCYYECDPGHLLDQIHGANNKKVIVVKSI